MIEQPFAIEDNVFMSFVGEGNLQFTSATLYIPAGTKALYESCDGWRNFKSIVEMAVIAPLENETTISTEGLGSENLSDNVVNDVYYNVGSEGYDSTDGSIVISQPTNMELIENAKPGTDDVKNNFTGIILKVAPGKGTILVNAKTSGNAQLVVQVGNGAPKAASKTEKGDVVVNYNVAEESYVYIYATIGNNARFTRASDDIVKIYGITISPDATGIAEVKWEPTAINIYYTLDGRQVVGKPTAKGIYILNGRKVVMK